MSSSLFKFGIALGPCADARLGRTKHATDAISATRLSLFVIFSLLDAGQG